MEQFYCGGRVGCANYLESRAFLALACCFWTLSKTDSIFGRQPAVLSVLRSRVWPEIVDTMQTCEKCMCACNIIATFLQAVRFRGLRVSSHSSLVDTLKESMQYTRMRPGACEDPENLISGATVIDGSQTMPSSE